ncbi:MAG: hypothetical protein FJ291_25730, partial [Planctomycetes bacterium]|nr:hypothetical protein [Planctomycetota bacterium]
DAIELNTSCPHGSITFRGKAVEETIFQTVAAVRQAVKLPIIAKLSPMLTSPLGVAKGVEAAGANAVTIFNRMTALEIDIQEERPVMHGGYAGHGGPWAIQYPLRWISAIRPQLAIDIAGSGGVTSWQDVVKYLLVGANAVQTCTAVIMNGYGVLRELRDGLERWMDGRGYGRLDDFRGKVNPRILSAQQVDRRKRFRAHKRYEVLAPCRAACPIGVSAQSYVRLVAEGRFEEAVRVVRASDPFQSICGRVCYAPCEDSCTRTPLGGPIAIRAIKRFVDEWGRRHIPLLKQEIATPTPTGKRVAIVGSGPAGLTAAHDLALLGHEATVFEALDTPGGMLRVGIPDYRLPKHLVDEEIEAIKRLGVTILTGKALGRGFSLTSLRSDGYDAILVATGAHKSAPLRIPGEDAKGVVDAIGFLRQVNLGHRPDVGKHVAVVGGGNTTLDAARCALRLGADVAYVVYRRTRAEMPAHEREIADAEAEGVRIMYLSIPHSIVVDDGRVAGLRCLAGYLAREPVAGRRPSSPVSHAEFILQVDTVLVAAGQRPDTHLLTEQGLSTNASHWAIADEATRATRLPGVFAGGDVRGGYGSVVHAIADGRRAANAIQNYLCGEEAVGGVSPRRDTPEPRALDTRMALARHIEKPAEPRVTLPLREPSVRLNEFAEVELDLDETSARREAARCLACGCGVGCGLCEKVCIYSAIEPRGGSFAINADKCDGCGLCTVRCANNAIELVPLPVPLGADPDK